MSNLIKTISVKDFTNIQEEYVANAAFDPGHLVEIMSTGKVRKHATAGGTAERMFAIENELEGRGVDDAYAAGDRAQVRIFRAGDVVNAILADGENVSIGTKLQSNGDGTLRAYVAQTQSFDVENSASPDIEVTQEPPDSIIGVAIEALDLSGSSGEESSGLKGDRRLQVRIL
jgi:hypothetical protein